MKQISDISLFMLDMDGTIYLGDRLFKCTIPFLNAVRAAGKQYIFLTNNSSKNRLEYMAKLARMGISAVPDDVFTSGEATLLYAKKTFPGARLCVMGSPSLRQDFLDAGFVLDDQNPDALILGFALDFNYERMTLLCNHVRSGIPYIATHPDYNCPVENGFIPDIGAVIAYVKASAGREPDKVVGKPHSGIVDSVIEKYGVKRDEIAMVGDRLYTDIALGANAGIASILVLSGETSAADYESSSIKADFIFDDLSGITQGLSS